MVWVSSKKISFTHGLNFFFWKIHFETIQFWIQENPMKKKTSLKTNGQSFIPKISFTHGLNFLKSIWNNPILNTGKSNMTKTEFKTFIYSLIQKDITSNHNESEQSHLKHTYTSKPPKHYTNTNFSHPAPLVRKVKQDAPMCAAATPCKVRLRSRLLRVRVYWFDGFKGLRV